jgi:hypothetical protein
MTDPAPERSTAERLLDLAFYAPLGLALSVADAVPDLARKGRARLGPQIGLARTVGQLAVRQGSRQLAGIATTASGLPFSPFKAAVPKAPGSSPAAPARSRPTGPATGATGRLAGAAPSDDALVVPLSPSRANGARHRGGRTPERSAASSLAIHSYDSLSAPQVVQRLAGLSREEVAAVQAYEAATRGRRTILARAEQLLG